MREPGAAAGQGVRQPCSAEGPPALLLQGLREAATHSPLCFFPPSPTSPPPSLTSSASRPNLLLPCQHQLFSFEVEPSAEARAPRAGFLRFTSVRPMPHGHKIDARCQWGPFHSGLSSSSIMSQCVRLMCRLGFLRRLSSRGTVSIRFSGGSLALRHLSAVAAQKCLSSHWILRERIHCSSLNPVGVMALFNL